MQKPVAVKSFLGTGHPNVLADLAYPALRSQLRRRVGSVSLAIYLSGTAYAPRHRLTLQLVPFAVTPTFPGAVCLEHALALSTRRVLEGITTARTP